MTSGGLCRARARVAGRSPDRDYVAPLWQRRRQRSDDVIALRHHHRNGHVPGVAGDPREADGGDSPTRLPLETAGHRWAQARPKMNLLFTVVFNDICTQ